MSSEKWACPGQDFYDILFGQSSPPLIVYFPVLFPQYHPSYKDSLNLLKSVLSAFFACLYLARYYLRFGGKKNK
jgi:hypothetical protein